MIWSGGSVLIVIVVALLMSLGAWIKDITKKMEGCEIKSIRPMDRSSTKSGFGSRALALVSLSVLSDTIFSALNINV